MFQQFIRILHNYGTQSEISSIKMELISELFCLSELSRVSAQYVKEEMGLYFIGKRIKNVSAFKNIKSIELKRSA